MDQKTILITGVSGAGSSKFCEKFRKNSEERGLKTKVYSTGDIMYEMGIKNQTPPIPPENFLNFSPNKITSLRDQAFEYISRQIKKHSNYDRILIDTQGQFFSRGNFYNGLSAEIVQDISPDLYLTIIDKVTGIKDKQMQTPMGRAQNHSLESILNWQNFEVNTTEILARGNYKPHYILPGKQEAETAESLLHSYFLIYFSIPMTEANEKVKQDISNFKEKLLEVGKQIPKYNLQTPIIDPRHIDIDSEEGMSEEVAIANKYNTIHRDLIWYIKPSTNLVVYYPKNAPTSSGVSFEHGEGHESGKTVHIVNEKEKESPFLLKSSKIFHDQESFFKYFKKHMKDSLPFYKRD